MKSWFFERQAEQSSACLSLRGTDTTWSAARQPRQGAPRAGNQASGRSGSIDNIVVKIRGIEEQYARSSCRSRRISPPCSIIALLRLLARPLKRSSRNSGAAITATSCYTTASSAAVLGHLGAVHKRGSGEKTARSRRLAMSNTDFPVASSTSPCGILRMPWGDSPASMSIHEGSAIIAERAMRE